MRKPVYLDNNATTPVDPRVLEYMLPYFSEHFGNAASRTHSFGWLASEAVEIAREQVATLIGATAQEIIFTSGATEAINLALKGLAETSRRKHIITCVTEHRAVIDTCRFLEQKGVRITWLPVDREGMVNPQDLQSVITDDTLAVCIMLANNETGVIQPLAELAAIAHAHGAFVITDATQAAGKIPVDVNDIQADLLCLSAHKMYGPKGAGALFVRRKNPRVTLSAQIHGGGHERGLRSGTLNVPAIAGLGKACELALYNIMEDGSRMSVLRTYLEQKLAENGEAFINGSVRNRLPNTTNIQFRNIPASELIARLPDIAFSTGSACSSALPEPSHVLSAMGLTEKEAYSSARFSAGRQTSQEEIEYAANRILEEVAALRKATS